MDEHPIKVVLGWNDRLKDRTTVLLHYYQIPDGTVDTKDQDALDFET